MKLIYFHGFGSSAAGSTVQTLRDTLTEFDVIAPDIPVDPAEALPYLKELCRNVQPDIIVGTSMGGMYAQQMRGYKRICVNPAFEMSTMSAALKSGTYEFFNPRADGQIHFTITDEIISHFAEMETRQFDGITDAERRMVWGLFGTNDDVVKGGDVIFRRHYYKTAYFNGGHRLNVEIIKAVLVPLIRKITFTAQEIDINEIIDKLKSKLGIMCSTEELVRLYNAQNLNDKDIIVKTDKIPECARTVFFPWGDVLGSLCTYPYKMSLTHELCPRCGSRMVSLYVSSPAWTWKGLCGRAGNMLVCPECPCQVSFDLTEMN